MGEILLNGRKGRLSNFVPAESESLPLLGETHKKSSLKSKTFRSLVSRIFCSIKDAIADLLRQHEDNGQGVQGNGKKNRLTKRATKLFDIK